MLTTFFPPFSFGGDGILVERLSLALARRGHDVTVVHDPNAWRALAGAADPPRPARPPGLHVVELDGPLGRLGPVLAHQLGRQVLHARRLRRVLAEGDFDVLHFHNVSLVGGPGVLAEGEGVKLLTAHDHWLVCPSHVLWRHDREPCTGRQCLRCVLHHGRPPQAWRSTGLLGRRLQHVDACLALSEFSRRKHAEFGFPREMDVVPPFAEAPAAAGPAAPAHDRPYVLFAGRLERMKGLDDVLPVFERYPDADLLVAGEGRHDAALRAQARGSRRIRFLGRLAQAELEPLYRQAVAVLVPSVGFETFSLVILEAFRQGTPVVARRIGPFPEILQASGGGVLFDSAADLPAALADVQRRRDELGRRARQAAETLWSEESVLARYLEVVRREAARRGRTRVLQRLAATG